jgi:hypothetical protein
MLEQLFLAGKSLVDDDAAIAQQGRDQVHEYAGPPAWPGRSLLCIRNLALHCAVSMMVGVLFLVLHDLAIKLVGHQVDGRIHAAVFRMGVEIAAADVQTHFHLVHQFFHLHDHLGIDYLIKMAFHTVEFLSDIVADGRGNLEMVAGNIEVHGVS